MIRFPHLAPDFSLGLCLAGECPKGAAAALLHALHRQGKPLLAADGGADHLAALGLKADLILGDGDSMTQAHPHIPRITYPRAKDFTDGAAAIAYALENYTGPIPVCGAAGGRTDMFYPIFLPMGLGQDIQRLQFFTEHTEAGYCQRECLITGEIGDTVSLIPLSPRAEGISLLGLEYPLQQETANFADTRLMSNVMKETQAEIKLEQGTLLVLHRIAERQEEQQP